MQVMYLHYLLGLRLIAQEDGPLLEREMRLRQKAKNIYILTLDGDVDFRPQAVLHLIEMLKRNKMVASACGRIHPTGSGMKIIC